MRNPDLRLHRGNYGTYRSNGNAAIDAYISDMNEPQQESEPLVIFSDITTEGILKELGISVFKTKLALNDRNYTRLPRILNLLLRGYDISKIDIKEKRKIVQCYIEILTSKYGVYNRAMDDKGLIETLRERLRAQLTDKKLMHAIWPEYQIDDGQGTDEELLKRYLEEKVRREGEDSQEINIDEYLLTISPQIRRTSESRAITNTSEITNVTKPRLSLVSENNFNAAEEETEELKKIFSKKNIFAQTEPLSKQTNTETAENIIAEPESAEVKTQKKVTTVAKVKAKEHAGVHVKPVEKGKTTRVPVTLVSREDLIQSTAETNAGNGRRQKLVARLRQGVSNSDISIQEKPQIRKQESTPKKVKVVVR